MSDDNWMVVFIVAGIALLVFLFIANANERENLYQECLTENVLTPFECKALAREMTRIDG